MSNFKPQVTVMTQESNRDYHMRQGKTPYKTIQYKTYRELLKNLPTHVAESLESYVTVSRSRRGEWGEWFEHWRLGGTKEKPRAIKIKEGWQ